MASAKSSASVWSERITICFIYPCLFPLLMFGVVPRCGDTQSRKGKYGNCVTGGCVAAEIRSLSDVECRTRPRKAERNYGLIALAGSSLLVSLENFASVPFSARVFFKLAF